MGSAPAPKVPSSDDDCESASENDPDLFGPLAAISDRELLDRFETQKIRKDEWTHAEHCRVGYLLIDRYDWAGAVDRMRKSIIKLNEAQGVPNTESRGYHETLTISWLRLIAAAMEREGQLKSSLAFLKCNNHLLDKNALAVYFSRNLLMSTLARQLFVHPDLQPLP